MAKVRIYIERKQIDPEILVSDKEIIHKLSHVLRLKPEDTVYVFDGAGCEHCCKLIKLNKKQAILARIKKEREEASLNHRVSLAFPLVNKERIDFILEKATELGISRFLPFTCQRSLQNKPSRERLKRWQRIMLEVVRQSDQLWVPTIEPIVDLGQIIKASFSLKLLGSIEGKPITSVDFKGILDTLIIVGPVGDFSPDEYDLLRRNDFYPIKLAPTILRVETAAVFFSGLTNYFLQIDK